MSSKEKTPQKKYYKGKNDICCLCGDDKLSSKFTDIFSSVGRRKGIAEKIQNVLGIAHEEIEGRPTKVCRSCQGKLDKFFAFKVSSLEMHKAIIRQVTSKRCLVFPPSESGPSSKAICTVDVKSPVLDLTEENTLTGSSEINLTNADSNFETGNPSRNYLNDEEKEDLLKAVESGSPSVVASAMAEIHLLKQEYAEMLLKELQQQCANLCARSNPSILRKNDFSSMTVFDWQNLILEMSTRCPLLFHVVRTVMNCHSKEITNEIAPKLGLCYAIMMQTRNHELSLVQRLNTILLTEGNAKKKVTRLNFHGVN